MCTEGPFRPAFARSSLGRASARLAEAPRAPRRPDELGPLLAMVGAGDEEALGAFYDSTCGLVYSLALRILRHPADAEEVTFDVYAQVWRSAPTFDPARHGPRLARNADA